MNQITVDQLARLRAPMLLDVREPDEYATGHAPGAVNIPLSELIDHVGDIPVGRPVHVICQSGRRSAQATALLTDLGIDAINVEGGTTAWIQNGHNVETNQS
ncbi:rhodanese-like domain-containing protein [Subtercola sp. RTI3]|uniref:rhodanese-like domain-containing protein n=1 Tax=Subtercola sp. RTI3 TaxID=3048639 RepID=UPI002B229B3A|nr:rhodanese-like domain-containing protein [Subtercola sp. RTI3]MEA9984228.1 rhodanese-like domain-containing protein [Subtercola sp. RTI3]